MRRRTRWLVWAGVLLALVGWPAGAQSDSVTIDDQPTTEQNLARINDLRRASRHDDAADLMQELIDDARFKLVSIDGGLYIDAELWARRELSRDPALLSAYRARFTASGERGLVVAQEDGSLHALREAYRRFGMTEPGLDAGLLLAGRLLEAGDVAAASALIEELWRHPDRLEAGGRVAYLRGVCAALRGDDEYAGVIADRLRTTDAALADRLGQFRLTLSIPTRGAAAGLADAGPSPQGLEAPLWETPISTPAAGRRPTFDGLRAVPVALGEQVLVNTGSQVLALDRSSGQNLWAYPEEVGQGAGLAMNLPTWLDTRGVAVSGGRVFAVLGACRGVQGRGGAELVPSNLLVCLDPQSGEVVWSRQSGDIDEDEPTIGQGMRGLQSALLQTHFVGTPVSAQGRVFTFVRKTSLTGLQTTWLAAFDARTGQLEWFRHIALVQVRHSADVLRLTPQLLVVGDTLYLTDLAAVAASIDVHSGAYRWLRVLASGRNQRANNLNLSSEGIHTPPVLTPAGLVVQLTLYEQRLFLLDPDTGRTLRTMEDDARLRGAQYLLDAGGDAVIVSLSYVVLWDGERGEVRWVHALGQGATPRGRGAVTREFVVIPTLHGSVVLRLSDGLVLDERDAITGNVTALDTEVLVSTNGALQSYMSWEGAYARLVRRVGENPQDAGPGLSLAFLALDRGESDDTVIEGIDYALQAVERMAAADALRERGRVFETMREMVVPGSAAGDALRGRVFDLMATTAQTARQSAAYHLERGRHLVMAGGYEQAVRHFQSVMVDPTLAAVGYGQVGSVAVSPAGAAAQRELLALIDEHGRSIYRRYDALAKQELETLLNRGETDPEALSQIAKRYPLALSASRALLIAAEQLEASGQPIGALSQYQQALASAMTQDQRQAAAGALLGYYERAARPGDALSLLGRLSQDAAVLLPTRAGEPATLESWREVFVVMQAHSGQAPDLPLELGQPIVLEGRLLLPPPGLNPDALGGSLLLHTADGAVERLDASAQPKTLWSAPVAGRQLYVLADDQGQLLVWSVDTRMLFALDSATGEPLWQAPADLGVLEGADATEAPRRVLPDALPWVHVGPSVVCFAADNGRVIGIDRFRGEMRWSVDTGIPRVTACAADPWTVVIAGVYGPELDLNHGKLMLLDLYSGNPVLDRVDLHVGFMPSIVGIDHEHLIAVAKSGTQAVLFDTASGETRWQQTLSDNDALPSGIAHDGLLAVEDSAGMVYFVRFAGDITVVSRTRLANRDGLAPTVMRRMGDGMLLFGPQGAVALAEDGAVRWRFAPFTGGGAIHKAIPGRSRVALIASVDPAGDPDLLLARGEAVHYRLDLVTRDGGLLERTYDLGPIHGQLDPRRAAVTHSGIAIAMGPRTLLVPAVGDASARDGDGAASQ